MYRANFKIPEIVLGALLMLGAVAIYAGVTSQSVVAPLQTETPVENKHSIEWWLAAFTAMLFLATLGLMVATVGLWYMAVRQSSDMQASLAIAEKSAEAAKQSAEVAKNAFEKIERPYALFAGVSSLLMPDEAVGRLHVVFNIANVGRTPALLDELYAVLTVVENPPMGDVTFPDSGRHRMGDVIGGGESLKGVVCYGSSEAMSHIEEINNRDLYLILDAAILYRDIFNQKHYTAFRWLYHPDRDYFASFGRNVYT